MPSSNSGFTAIDWLIVAIYLLLMIAMGAVMSRRQESLNDFFLGRRTVPTWAAALSVVATALSAATFIGAPQFSYQYDLTYLILNVGGVIAAFVVAFVFIPPLYRAGTITIYGYLEQRFGMPAKIAASAVFLLGRLMSSGARLFIAGIAVSLALSGATGPWHLASAILIFGLVGTLYTVCGGIRAVIWTDTVQIVVVVFAAGLSIYLLLKAIPLSGREIVEALRNADGVNKLRVVDLRLDWSLPYTIWAGVLASTFVSTQSYAVDQDMIQRMMTVRSAWRAGAAMIGSIFLMIPVVCVFLVIGLLLSIYYGRPELMGDAAPLDSLRDTKEVFPQFLLNHVPAGLRGLTMAGLFAAAMSTFDSAINAMASAAVADLYIPWQTLRKQKRSGGTPDDGPPSAGDRPVRTSRIVVALIGALLTASAILAIFAHAKGAGTLIDFALGVMAFAHAPLLGVFSAAILTGRGNNASVIAALVSGVIVVLLLQPYMLPQVLHFQLAWPWWSVVASPVSFLVCVLGRPVGRSFPQPQSH